MTAGDFTKQMARAILLTPEERFSAARAIGSWRRAQRNNLDTAASLEAACKRGGWNLPLRDWVHLALILAPSATAELAEEIWTTVRLRRMGEELKTRASKPKWVAIIAGRRIPTSAAVIAHFRRAHGDKFPIEFELASDDEQL